MKKFITATLSLLLLLAVFAPAVVSFTSIEPGVAMAQALGGANADHAASAGAGATTAQGNAFLGEKELTRALQGIGGFFLQIGATFLWLAGALFNFGIKYSILDFANFSNIAGITIAWTVFRDIANVFFIFIFLAIGISTILGIQQFNVKKLLPILLGVAILINFSLFFTKVTIDIAHGFAGAILNQSGVVTTECNGENDCRISQGVATAFIEQLGVIDIFGKSVETSLGPPVGEGQDTRIFNGDRLSDGFGALMFGFFGFIFLSAAAIVFLAGAVMLIMRIVTLLLLMVAAAPAFAAFILPSTKKHFDTWLNTLIKEAVFAPVLLLLFAVSLLFLNTARVALPGLNGEESFADVFINGNLASVDVIIIFLISLGLLFTSIKVANDMGVSGAKMAMGVQKWGQGIAGRATIGSGSRLLDTGNRFVQRNIKAGAGRVSGAIAAKEGDGAGTRVGKFAARRAAGLVNLTAGNLVRGVDVGISDAAKQGLSETFGSKYSTETLKDRTEKRGKELDAANTKAQKEQNLSAAENIQKEAGETDDEFQLRKNGAIQTALQEMKDAEIVELKATRLATEAIAQNLTPAKFKKLLESENISDAEKEEISNSRFKPLNEAMDDGRSDDVKRIAKSLSKDEIEVLPSAVFANADFAQGLKQTQFDEIKKSGSFTPTQKKAIGDLRTQPLKSAIRDADLTKVGAILTKMGDAAVAKLDKEDLESDSVIANLTPSQLAKIQREDGVSASTKSKIAEEIRGYKDLNPAAYSYLNSPTVKDLW